MNEKDMIKELNKKIKIEESEGNNHKKLLLTVAKKHLEKYVKECEVIK